MFYSEVVQNSTSESAGGSVRDKSWSQQHSN